MLAAVIAASRSQGHADSGAGGERTGRHIFVQVFDQASLGSPSMEPVPKYLQRGEESWKLDTAHVCKWLSGALGRSVTSVYTAAGLPSSPSALWSLRTFRNGAEESPFVEGAVVVCCCDCEHLRGDLAKAFAGVVRGGMGIQSPWKPAPLPILIVAEVESVLSADPVPRASRQPSCLQPPRRHVRRADCVCENKMTSPASQFTYLMSDAGTKDKFASCATEATYVVSDAQAEHKMATRATKVTHVVSGSEAEDDTEAEEDDGSEMYASETESSEEGGPAWVVDNRRLRSTTGGLREQRRKSLSDHRPCALVPWGETVHGVDDGDGWLRLPDGNVMPIHVDGVRVLTPKRHVAQATLSPDVIAPTPLKTWVRETSEASTRTPTMTGWKTGDFGSNASTDASDASQPEVGAASRADRRSRETSLNTETEDPSRADVTWTWSIFSGCATTSRCAPRRGADGGHSDDEGVPSPSMLLS